MKYGASGGAKATCTAYLSFRDINTSNDARINVNFYILWLAHGPRPATAYPDSTVDLTSVRS